MSAPNRAQPTVTVALVGTSWWVDAMYLPALHDHPHAEVVAICGRNRQRAEAMAARWEIPRVYTDYQAMLADGGFEAIIIASANDTHYPMTMAALEQNLHVLCEKPLALSYADAAKMAAAAKARGVKQMTPFTYANMPTARYLKQLIDGGYLGRPYHLNLRYYTGFGRDGQYLWRFDADKAGAGAVGDIGSHFLYLAQWFFGEVTGLFARLGTMIERPPLDPDGRPYRQADDSAILTLRFASGALGSVHVSTVALEPTPFGQVHQMEFHGSEGTLHSVTDWDTVQQVRGTREGEGPLRELPIPEEIWQGARRDTVHNTYKDVFRSQEVMARAFITAIVHDLPLRPDFADGAAVQRLIEAALLSDREGRWVEVSEVTAEQGA